MPPLAMGPDGPPPHRETRFRRLRLEILGLCTLVTIVITGASINLSVEDRAERIHHAEADSRSLVRSLDQHAARIFDNGGQFLLDLRSAIEPQGAVDAMEPSKLQGLLTSERVHDRTTPGAYVVNSTGTRIVSSTPLLGSMVPIFNQEYFKRHETYADRGIAINAPALSRIHGRWVIPLTVRLESKAGRFDGVAVLEVEVDYLNSFYRSLGLRDDSAVAVVSADGTVYARYPSFEQVAGKRMVFPPDVQASMSKESTIDLVSPVDGVVRITSFRKLTGYPIGVALAYSRDLVLRDWRSATYKRAVQATIVLGVIWFFAWLLLRRLESERAATVSLARSEHELLHLNATLEKRVADRTEEVTRAHAELEAFSYSVSHDLRAPLRHVAGYVAILEQECASHLSPECRQHVTRIVDRVGHMDELIESLLALSQVSRQSLDHEDVDLSAHALELVADLREAEPERAVEVAIPPDLKVRGDRALLRTLLQNLIENAWKYSSKIGLARIEMGAWQEGEEQVFYVRDNGAGFDPQYATRLFAPFQRLHSPQDFKGTGIGLATAKRIVERHSGRIWAQGEVGRGATVFFSVGTAAA